MYKIYERVSTEGANKWVATINETFYAATYDVPKYFTAVDS